MSSEKNGNGEARRGWLKLPSVVYEIEPHFAMAARLSASPAGVCRMAAVDLPAGLVQPSPVQANIGDAKELGHAVRSLRKSVGRRRPWALMVPDAVARVNIISFETLPAKAAELQALLRWKIRDTLGFAPEEARLSHQVTHRGPGEIEMLVTAVKEDVRRQYEEAVDSRNDASLMLPVTLALLTLLPETEPGGQLLTHVCSGWVTNAVVEGNRLRFWRNRALAGSEADGDAPQAAAAEASRAAASVRDRWGIEIRQAWCCARPEGSDALRRCMSEALGIEAEVIVARERFSAGLRAKDKPLFQPLGAPVDAVIAATGRLR